jgi:hypothetical protein
VSSLKRLLQNLSSRVDGFDAWYAVRREALSADPLMQYFHSLRNEIEKQGLPGMMAELFDRESGKTIADVACGEDRFGIWVSGAVRQDVEFQARSRYSSRRQRGHAVGCVLRQIDGEFGPHRSACVGKRHPPQAEPGRALASS